MSKKKTLIAFFLFALFAAFAGIFAINLQKQSSELTNESAELPTQQAGATENIPIPENAYLYTFTNGQTSYVAKKRFVGKNIEDVIGTTTDVSGYGWYDPNENTVFVKATVNLENIDSGSKSRDADVLSMLSGNMVEFTVDTTNLDTLEMGRDFRESIEGQLLFNGVLRTVTFDVAGFVDENEFTAEGISAILLTDFGLTPPKLINVADIDNEIVLKFGVTGSRSN